MRRLLDLGRWGSKWLLALGFVGACTPGADTLNPPMPDLAGPPEADMMQPPVIEGSARFVLLRSVRWPGGGREFTLGILDKKSGQPLSADLAPRIEVKGQSGIKLAAARRVPGPGFLAILLPPSLAAEERAGLAKSIAAFAEARPKERIALYRHGETVQLFSGYLADRAELSKALNRYQAGTDDAAPLALDKAVDSAVDELKEVFGEGTDGMRSLVVLGADPSQVPTDSSDVLVVASPLTAAGLEASGAYVDEVRNRAFYRVSVCAKVDKFEAEFQVKNFQGDKKATFSATLPEEAGTPCNVDAIDTDKRSYTPRIELVFNDTQRAAHDERIRATQRATYNEELAKSDFETQIRLAPGQPAILATAHLRGNSTLSCERKSYTLKLSGPDRHLIPGAATDEYYLISMCDDRAYSYMRTAYDLFSDDLFPLKQRYVEFVIDGRHRGIYLLVEKSKEGLIQKHARVTTVMRRDYPKNGMDVFEVDYPTTGDLTAPLTRYAEFAQQADALSGDDLVWYLRSKMDLDQYLRWVASQSVLQSGDYVDEVVFFGTEHALGDGQVQEEYRIMPWDPEGYSACHSGGMNAYMDPYQLAYCAEGRLEFKLLGDEKVYDLFVDKLEQVLSGSLAPDKVASALTRTKTAMQSMLSSPEICAAMVELRSLDPRSADCAVAKNLIAARTDALKTAYDARRTLLLSRIAAYRGRP